MQIKGGRVNAMGEKLAEYDNAIAIEGKTKLTNLMNENGVLCHKSENLS